MKIRLIGAEALQTGVLAVCKVLPLAVVASGEDVSVRAVPVNGQRRLRLVRKGKEAVIEYSERSTFFRGLSLLCQHTEENFSIEETARFQTNGAMFDVSRNAVLRPESVKQILTYMALMGHNMCMLYTEDTYPIENRPYFGHMRGGYTAAEIRDMDDFAAELGIELIPCIQVLAHLSTMLKWDAFWDVWDINDILMADNEKTYALIEDMFKSLAGLFRSRKVHLGMDEAHYLGRGKYLDQNGYHPRPEIFCRHLNRCREIAIKYGFSPMMWSDMFFRMADSVEYSTTTKISEEIINAVPRDVGQVFWKYSWTEEEDYAIVIRKHREFSDHVLFAGCIWTWTGPAPAYGMTIAASVPALKACMKEGVKDVIATIWHNGAECPLVFSMLGLVLYAEMDFTGAFDLEQIKERFTAITGVDAEDILQMDLADHPDGSDRSGVQNPTRFLLHNDPIAGLMDKQIEGIETQNFYRSISKAYQTRGQQDGFFKKAFDYYRALIAVLEIKADFGLRLKKAYDQKDAAQLKALYDESCELQKRIEAMQNVHRKLWLYYNKSCGFEEFDLFYGAQRSRLETLRFHLDRLFADPSYVIDELEEDRLPYFSNPARAKLYTDFRFLRNYSANVID